MPGAESVPPAGGGRQLIQSYGGGRFRIAGQSHVGSQLVFADRTMAWDARVAEDITLASLAQVTDFGEGVRILLVGCGRHFAQPPRALLQELRERGIVVEWMDTGAACRTFNVLISEDRDVAAALIVVD